MRYIEKQNTPKNLALKFNSHKSAIRTALLFEQTNRCAYSGEYLDRKDREKGCDIEHFNDTLKTTILDSYDNWHLVLNSVHRMKKSKSFKKQSVKPTRLTDPILLADLSYNLLNHKYESRSRNANLESLIDFIGVNNDILVEDREMWFAIHNEEFKKYRNQNPNSTYLDYVDSYIAKNEVGEKHCFKYLTPLEAAGWI